MKRIISVSIIYLLLVNPISSQEKPKVLIGIVVDQMRNDYIYKFWNDYGEEGFKKLVNNGTYATNINYSYKPTYTGPGHATIFTGTTPSNHGIVGNNWYSRKEQKMVYCAEALNANNEYWYSPERMLSRSIADEIKLFTNSKGKSFGVSLKDRGAILPAGHMADAAFWFEGKDGGWISSDYYAYKNMTWVNEINQIDIYDKYLKDGWKLSKEQAAYNSDLEDDNPYERPYLKGEKTSFPYNFKKVYKEKGNNLIKATPYGNQMVIDFAKQLIQEEEIGKDNVLDFLSISFSSTDYIGHQFGVNSREVHDTYIKLDNQLAEFLTYLDNEIGEGNYLLFLTSDHGAGEAREMLIEKELGGGYLDTKTIEKELNTRLKELFGEADYIEKLTNLNVYFTANAKKSKKAKKIINFSKTYLEKQNGVKAVYSRKELSTYGDRFQKMAANGYLNSESGELIILEMPNWNTYGKQGSTHGSPYSYDTHVPLIFYGWNVSKGQISEPYTVSQIAATISNLLGIPRPDFSSGDIIKGVK